MVRPRDDDEVSDFGDLSEVVNERCEDERLPDTCRDVDDALERHGGVNETVGDREQGLLVRDAQVQQSSDAVGDVLVYDSCRPHAVASAGASSGCRLSSRMPPWGSWRRSRTRLIRW